jgi:hypothetical protein
MKPTLKNLLIAFIVAVPVAFIVLPYSFELLATILFGGLFLLVTAYDYVHADHVQHPEHYHHDPSATHPDDKSHGAHPGGLTA